MLEAEIGENCEGFDASPKTKFLSLKGATSGFIHCPFFSFITKMTGKGDYHS